MWHAHKEQWPLLQEFRIARGTKRIAEVVVVSFTRDGVEGRGECVPYPRYGESAQDVIRAVNSLERKQRGSKAESADEPEDEPEDVLREMTPGALRNGLDCALWDWRARRQGKPVWEMLGLPRPQVVTTAFTIGIGTVDEMHAQAVDNAERPVLKVKLGADDAAHDAQRLLGVRAGAPAAQIIVDANEGWNIRTLEAMLATADECGVALIEQPLPVGADAALLRLDSPVPIGADESVHTAADLDQLREKYDVVNVKLDKTGGLTHALKMIECARALDFEIMVGCMVATSLSMAPAMLLAPLAKFVDLDGPLLLRDDRHGGLIYENSTIRWSANRFWGEP